MEQIAEIQQPQLKVCLLLKAEFAPLSYCFGVYANI
jgi:hypothetical protein